MVGKYSDNYLDNLLFCELHKEHPSKEKIRKLVSRGANISAINESNESVLMNAIFCTIDGLDPDIVRLIVELGADVNYTCEGFNCLYFAALAQNPELFRFLLDAGADPNCISAETPESLLDWAKFDQWYEESESREGGEIMAEIVAMLESYGAKTATEIFTTEVDGFLDIFATDRTGLVTRGVQPKGISISMIYPSQMTC